MTQRQFSNAIRILFSIDRDELVTQQVVLTGEQWDSFRRDPIKFFLRADDDTADRLWAIIERRNCQREAA